MAQQGDLGRDPVQQGQHAATQRGDDDGLLAEARGQAQLSAGCATSAPRGSWAGYAENAVIIIRVMAQRIRIIVTVSVHLAYRAVQCGKRPSLSRRRVLC